MTSRAGRRNRKKVPKPRLDNQTEFKMPSIVCPYCNNHFDVGQLQGAVGDRSCPFCNEEINSRHYNDIAKLVIQEKCSIENELADLRCKLNVTKRQLEDSSVWWKFLKYLFLKIKSKYQFKRLKPEIDSLESQRKIKRQKLKTLARNSYYVSEWFLHTHFLIENSEGKLLNVQYSNDATIDIWVYDKHTKSSGFKGEFFVFNTFLSESLNRDSPLFGSRLLPNIYVPVNGRGDGKKSFWTQIDLVVLTKSSAFIIETKSWNSHVFVDADSGKIFSTKQGNNQGESLMLNDMVFFESTFSLNQNSNHASWFYENFREYPFDRIFEVTLFVNPKSFTYDLDDFSNNIYTGVISDDDKEAVEIISKASSSLDNLFSDEKVNMMADELLDKYGDLNQKRGRIHADIVRKNERLIN